MFQNLYSVHWSTSTVVGNMDIIVIIYDHELVVINVTKTFFSRPRPRLQVSRPRPRSSRAGLEAPRDQDQDQDKRTTTLLSTVTPSTENVTKG